MKIKKAIPILLLILTLLGCTLGKGDAPPPDDDLSRSPDAAETAVTTATLSPTGTPDDLPRSSEPTLPPPTETPTLEPSPTLEPTQTASLLRVAYVDESGNVSLWTEGAGVAQLTTLGGVTGLIFSDDGQYVAYTREIEFSQTELRVANTDGSDDRTLVSVEDFQALAVNPFTLGVLPFHFEWIPGTHTIIYNTYPVFEGPGLAIHEDLRVVDADTLEQRALFEPGSGGEFVISPDGQQIAIITPETISLVNTDGANLRRNVVRYPLVLTYSEHQYYARPVWAADSSYMLTVIPPAESLAEPLQPAVIWRIPADGSPGEIIGEIYAAPFFGGDAVISPDLTKVAFPRLVGDLTSNEREIVITNVDGTGEIVYDRLDAMSYVTGWSPDSQHFLYWVEFAPNVFMGQADADDLNRSSPIPFTDMGFSMDVRWIDESRYLFLNLVGEKATYSGRWEIRLGEIGGGSVVLVEVLGKFVAYDFVE